MVTTLQLQYLRLLHCDVLTRNDRCRLIRQYGSIAAIQAADSHELLEVGISPIEQQQLSEVLGGKDAINESVSKASNWLNEDPHRRHLICFEDSDYPPLLKEIPCPPILLFVLGDLSCLRFPQLAIVGSRRSSSNGDQIATWLAGELATLGFCIVSGLAAGVDSRAHQGALARDGKTIGVLGTGIDRVYPPRNRQLAMRLCRSGALLTEFGLGTPPIAGNFPQRNRIIAGLALGVIVVEATVKSGSLITARLAMENNREVFAIPGSIHSANSRGCHHLIREGAKLVEDVNSVIEELAGPLHFVIHNSLNQAADIQGSRKKEVPDLESGERELLKLMDFDPLPAEVLAARAGVGIEQLNRMLTNLELKGYLQQSAGRYQRLAGGLQRESR